MGRKGALSTGKRNCVVIFASEDVELARVLVAGLRSPTLNVWSSEDINHGDWGIHVRSEIDKCDAVIPVVTQHTEHGQVPNELEAGAEIHQIDTPGRTSDRTLQMELALRSAPTSRPTCARPVSMT